MNKLLLVGLTMAGVMGAITLLSRESHPLAPKKEPDADLPQTTRDRIWAEIDARYDPKNRFSLESAAELIEDRTLREKARFLNRHGYALANAKYARTLRQPRSRLHI